MMRRRKFITLLGGAAAAWPMGAGAQQPVGRLPRIGIFYFGWNENIAAFLQGSRDGGHIDGQSAIIEAR
jgi:putative ABC transport system substrate-binding protein